jgi:DNA-binding MarR family transcriptional regulator
MSEAALAAAPAQPVASSPPVERPAAERPDVVAVADNFVALMRNFQKTRARLMAAAANDVEWSAHVLLKCLHSEGPMRASAIADVVHSDPSTVSRQVAALVKDGLLERRADPADGRASILVLTPAADEVLAEHDRIRLEHFERMLEGWSDSDLRRFAGLLGRFTEAYATNIDWIKDRATVRSTRTEGTY